MGDEKTKKKRGNKQNLKMFSSTYQPKKNGRPKKIPALEELFKKHMLEESKGETDLDRVIKSLKKNAIKGDIQSIQYLLNRIYGKPREQKEEKEIESKELSTRWHYEHRPIGIQWDIYEANKRFIVLNVGRQFGKSELGQLRLARRAEEKEGVYWWLSPTYSQARVVFRRFLKNFKKIISKVNKSELMIELYNESVIFFKSEEKPDNLRGETLNGAVLDEYASYKLDTWDEIIRPMLGTTEGWVDFLSTPKGKNHFWKLYNDAKKDPNNFDVFEFPSNASPFFSQSEFDLAKKSLPSIIFEQEYLAKFIDDNTGVFRGLQNCISDRLVYDPSTPIIQKPYEHYRYVIGLDIAKHLDFTVITVFNAHTKELVYYDRFNQMPYSYISDRVVSVSKKYNNALIVMDATGIGDALIELIQGRADLLPIKFTNSVKQNLIYSLALAIENQEITLPNIPEMVQEIQNYSLKILSSGLISYNAPEGQHDDIVISIALAVSRLKEETVNIDNLIM
jgi:hypothetical protein